MYLPRVPFEEPGTVQVAAITGDDHGRMALPALRPESSEVPAPGADAVPVRTPTEEDDRGISELCTRSPDPCGAHEVSLDAALGDGRPALLLFATPAYCQTAVCGPAVDMFEELRADRDWGDVAFVHCEIFASPPGDDGAVLAELVEAWRLPSEPWMFAIDRDGRVADRREGAIIAGEALAMAERLAG